MELYRRKYYDWRSDFWDYLESEWNYWDYTAADAEFAACNTSSEF